MLIFELLPEYLGFSYIVQERQLHEMLLIVTVTVYEISDNIFNIMLD